MAKISKREEILLEEEGKKKYSYSVLSYGFGGYEKIREVQNPDSDVEYIYVTDDPNASSETWQIVYDPTLEGLSNYDKVYKVKYHPWDYVSSDIVFRMDGSVQILQSLHPIISHFNNNNLDIEIMVHPYRSTVMREYQAWVQARGLNPKKAERFEKFLKLSDWDKNYHGLFETTICLERKTDKIIALNNDVYDFIMFMNEGFEDMDKNDQCYYSYIVNRFYSDVRMIPLSEQVIHSRYLQWCKHNEDTPVGKLKLFEAIDDDLNYVFNKPTICYHF